MRIIFAGTPPFAAQHLAALVGAGHDIVAVYTQPDRAAGRGKKPQASAVKQLALTYNLPVEQPQSLKDTSAQQQLANYNADVMIVVAYGLILPQAVLDMPTHGCINVHGSLLPRWRGAAPIQRAIWNGDQQSGIAIMQMAAGLDTGPVLLQKEMALAANETSASLYEKMANFGPPALLETLANLSALQQQLQPQDDSQATYAHKLDKAEAELNWNLPAELLERHIRAFNPWPVSWLALPEGVVKVWQAEVQAGTNATVGTVLQVDKAGIVIQTSKQALRITELQPPGKKSMPAAAFLNGRASWFTPGQVLALPTPTDS
ncbi:MAG: methionyl-tRNA formyltransferase [Idiomarina sp.]